MNRKLHNTILAFSVTGVMLFVGMVVADPAPVTREGARMIQVPAASLDDNRADATPSTGSARPDELAAPAHPAGADVEAAVAMAAGLLAISVTEVALSAMRAELEPAADKSRTERSTQRTDTRPRRKARASRELIAVPYFSFARGSRGSRS